MEEMAENLRLKGALLEEELVVLVIITTSMHQPMAMVGIKRDKGRAIITPISWAA